jgi:hypothetical protein
MMEVEEMMQLLLNEMKVMQEKGEADRKGDQDLLAKLDANQEKTEANIDREERKPDRRDGRQHTRLWWPKSNMKRT